MFPHKLHPLCKAVYFAAAFLFCAVLTGARSDARESVARADDGAHHSAESAAVDAATAQPLAMLPQKRLFASNESPSQIEVEPARLAATALQLYETTNVLVLGSDRRQGQSNWRTDVMMIVSLDFQQQRAGIVSIPRDLFLYEIPGHRSNRINVVDYLGEQDHPEGGGPQLLIDILEERLEIPIKYYVRFSFQSFMDVVDALDGIELEIACETEGSVVPRLNLGTGVHLLDGRQALNYVRSRKLTSDLDRARRQQRVVWAVRNKMRNENLLARLPALYAALSNTVDTDIGIIRAIQFARFGMRLEPDGITGLVLEPPNMLHAGWQRGMSVFLPDWPQIQYEVERLFERDPFDLISASERCS